MTFTGYDAYLTRHKYTAGVLDTPELKFYFKNVAPLNDALSQNVIAIPFINTSAKNTLLFRFSGKAEDLIFTFALTNDGQDHSDGTYAYTVITIEEQITYLREFFFSHEFDTYWTLTQARFAPVFVDVAIDAFDCVITNLNFDNPAGYVGVVVGNISLKRGRIGLQ
jgi:hypothetical protein